MLYHSQDAKYSGAEEGKACENGYPSPSKDIILP